jgi:hypothetical protein
MGVCDETRNPRNAGLRARRRETRATIDEQHSAVHDPDVR